MKLRCFLLAVMIFLPNILFAEKINGVGEISSNNVRLRAEGNITAEIITKMMKAQSVEILGYNHNLSCEDNKFYFWVNVKINDYIGWVYSKYLVTDLYFPFYSSDIDIFKGLGMPDWNIKLFCINNSTTLYDKKFMPALKLSKSDAMMLDQEYYSSRESAVAFYIHLNKLIYFLPVYKNSKTYFVSILDVTPWYYVDDGKITYVTYDFGLYFLEDDLIPHDMEYREPIYCFIPFHRIVQEQGQGQGQEKYIIYESSSSADNSYICVEKILSFGMYDEIYFINQSIVSGPLNFGGGYTESSLIMTLEGKKLCLKKTILSQDYDDGSSYINY